MLMNRKQRRIQSKVERSAPLTNTIPLHAMFNEALLHHQSGRLAEAEALYRRILAVDERHADALHSLGVVAYQVERFDVAIDLIGKAIGINGSVAAYYSNRGNALKELGRLEDALASCDDALRIKPDFADALSNRGNVLKYLGRFDEALASCDDALRIKPDFAEALSNRGNALKDLGRLDDALASYDAALRIKPDFAEALSNRGLVLKDLGRLDDALASCDAALRIRPNFAGAHSNLGIILGQLGKSDDGLSHCEKSIRLKETSEAKSAFVKCLTQIRPCRVPARHFDFVARALRENWSRPQLLAPAIIGSAMERIDLSGFAAVADGSDNLSAKSLFRLADILSEDRLFLEYIRRAPVQDADFEKMLTSCRAAFLEYVVNGGPLESFSDRSLELFCALADQCFINEFVFDCSERETIKVQKLRLAIDSELAAGQAIELARLIALGCYVQIGTLVNAALLLNFSLPTPVKKMLQRHFVEPRLEMELRSNVRRLTSIDVGVSSTVRQMYEENPYPRWIEFAQVTPHVSVEARIRSGAPRAVFIPPTRKTIDILVAGCGTGQHPISTAQTFPQARILAVDLSISSLGYALRKAGELALPNLEFAQADILNLGSLGRRFDVIEAVGVLHHLADPVAGLEVLVSLLHPNGFMRLGLYSDRARRPIVAVRDFISKLELSSSVEDIRRLRREIRALDEADLRRKVTKWLDFASISECRDLLFHVQEHRCTLPEISGWLAELKLKFVGFDIDPETRHAFQCRFPAADSEANLMLWDAFEIENPDTFFSMFQFWAQKCE